MRSMQVLSNRSGIPRLGLPEARGPISIPARLGNPNQVQPFPFVTTWISLKTAVERGFAENPPPGAAGESSNPPPPVEINWEVLATIDQAPALPAPAFRPPRPGRWQMVVPQMQGRPSRAFARELPPAVPQLVSGSRSTDATFESAVSLLRTERWDAALSAFKRALASDPDHFESCLGAGLCLLEMNRFEEALWSFSPVGARAQDDLMFFGKAVALQKLRRCAEARTAYEKLIPSEPGSGEALPNLEALSNLIAIEIELGDLAAAWGRSMELLAICPDSLPALLGLATVALENSADRNAAFFCDCILARSPESLEAWHNYRIAVDRGQVGFLEGSGPCWRPQ
jgi:tetratricopeptide (TPR) repeat protein